MTSRDFCYWLQGYIELNDSAGGTATFSGRQSESIRKHLALVFKHEIDPSAGSAAHQNDLNLLHGKRPDGAIERC